MKKAGMFFLAIVILVSVGTLCYLGLSGVVASVKGVTPVESQFNKTPREIKSELGTFFIKVARAKKADVKYAYRVSLEKHIDTEKYLKNCPEDVVWERSSGRSIKIDIFTNDLSRSKKYL